MALLEWEDGFSYAIELDCSENENYEDTNETTDRAVERGGTVTDHVRQNPGTITIEGTITNSPMRALAPTRDRSVSTQSVKLRDGSAVAVQAWDTDFDRVKQTDELFQQLMEARSLVTLTTGLRTTEELVLVRCTVKRDGQTGNSVQVVLDFKRIRFATSQRATVQPVERRAIPPQQRGAQPADNRSVLARLLDSATGD